MGRTTATGSPPSPSGSPAANEDSPYRQQNLQVIFAGVCITMKGLNTATESQFVWDSVSALN